MRFIQFILITLIATQAFAAKTLEEKLEEAGDPRLKNTARQHVDDPYRVERLAKKGEYLEECNDSSKSINSQFECINSASAKWNDDYPDRGTKGYGDKFYSDMTKEQALKKIDELKEMMEQVSFAPEFGSQKTELLVDHLHGETMYIEQYVLNVRPKDYRPYK